MNETLKEDEMKLTEKLSGFIGKKIIITLHTEAVGNKPLQEGGILNEVGDDYIAVETFILDEKDEEVYTGEDLYLIRHIKSICLFESGKFAKRKKPGKGVL
ncbi:MAG: hypothetical protein NTZ92_05460 [Candidatus Omnitrophica bacterium]|nr:hypothetical protein [Candidatus Omnitrophota bacterium]